MLIHFSSNFRQQIFADSSQINYEKILEAINGCSIKAQGYYNVPSRHSRHFMGRQEMLNKLKELPPELSPGLMVLRGLGGQGKSQIALEYCRQTRYSPFKTTFWIDATSDNTIKRDFDLFYQRFRNQSDDRLESANTIIDFVRDSFERMTEPWLLVFDNYDNPKIANIRDYIPTSNLGSILVTTRSNEVMDLASPGFAIEVEALGGEDAADLLLACSGLEQNIDSEEIIAKDIVKSLSNHALAIAQAGAYLRKLKLPLAEFLDHYQKNQRSILEQDLPMAEYQRKLDSSEKATSLNVFTTWELSFKQLLGGNDSNKLKEDLLTLLGFSYSQHMSEEMFKIFCTNISPWDTVSAMKKLPGAFLADRLGDWDSVTFGSILAELYDLCLIQSYYYGEDGFYHVSLHPLVKDWIKLRTEKEFSWEYQILSAEILVEAINPSKGQPSDSSTISPYLRAEIQSLRIDDKDAKMMTPTDANAATRLLGLEESLAMLMTDAGNYRESEKINFRISRAVERTYGTNDLQTVKAKFQLAKSKWHMGKYRESEALLRSLQETSIALQGLQGYLTMQIRSWLGRSLLELGQLTEARAIQEDLLAHAKKSDGLVPETANNIISLARILIQQKCYEEAEILLESALAIPDLEWAATYYLNGTLGGLYHHMRNWKRAEAHYSVALSGLLLELGQDHPSTLIFHGNLAHCQAGLGLFENSMESFKTVIGGLQRVLGIGHPQTILQLRNIMIALFGSLPPDDVEARFRGLVDPQNSEQDLFFAEIMGTIARQMQHEGDFLEFAKIVASWSLSTWSKIAGPSDPRVLSAEELVHSFE